MIKCCGYYLFRHPILCGYYSRVAFIKLRGIATAAEIQEPDPFTNIDEEENELEENEVVLDDC